MEDFLELCSPDTDHHALQSIFHAQKKDESHKLLAKVKEGRSKHRREKTMCSVIESVSVPLPEFRSMRELVEATRDAMKGHQHLYEKRQTLHRDVSVNNIMISVNPAAEGGAKGFSIDLEHAVFLQQKRPTSNIREMAGTFYFIAIERQRPRYSREHRAYHDLESFYWSLVYTTLRHTVTSEDPQYCVKALEGEEGFGKMAFITHIRTRLTVAFNPRLSACLKSFGEVVRESSKAESADQRMTHEAAINSLDEELEKPGWRENDKAVTFSLLDVPPEEELEHDRKEHSAVLRLMKKVDSSCTVRQAALKRKAGDEADDGQNEEVKAGESSDSKHCPRRPM